MVPTEVQRKGELSMSKPIATRTAHIIKDFCQKINVSKKPS